MSSRTPTDEIPADDDPRRLAAALGYLFTPVVPLINMTGESGNERWMRYHSVQALLWSGPFILLLAAAVIALVLLASSNFLYICLMPVLILVPFVPGAIWARRIYLGDEVAIPILSNFLTGQPGNDQP